MLFGQTGKTDRTDGRTDGRMGDRDMERGKTSQDSPPVTVVGGDVAPAHGHRFVVVG